MNTSAAKPSSAAILPEAGFGLTDFLLVLMTVIWGSNFTAIKYSLEDIQPLSFSAMRFALASVTLLAATLASGKHLKVARGDGWRLLGLGLIANVAYQPMFIIGVAHTTAGNAALILATTPLFTAVIGRFQKHEYFTRRAVLGLLLTLGGIVLIISSGRGGFNFGESVLGDSLLLGSTLCWSLYTIGSRRFVHLYGSMKATTIMMVSSTPALVLVCIPSLLEQNWSGVRGVSWAGLVYSALFSIALAYFIWAYGVRRIGSTRTAVYSNLTPVFAMLVAWPALGEIPTPGQLGGAIVIFAGLYLVRRGMTHVSPAGATEEEIEEACLRPGEN